MLLQRGFEKGDMHVITNPKFKRGFEKGICMLLQRGFEKGDMHVITTESITIVLNFP
jgi:hypothetical protein